MSSSRLDTVIIAVTFSLGPKLITLATGVPLEVLDWSAESSNTLKEKTLPLSVKNRRVSCVSATCMYGTISPSLVILWPLTPFPPLC